MAMKTSVVVADGTFPTATAPILGPIEDTIRQAAQLGYDAVSITVEEPEQVDISAIRAACEKYGVAVSGLATGRLYSAGGYCLGSADEENRLQAVDKMMAHAEHCAALDGARLIVGTVRGWVKDGGDRETHARQFRKSMEALIKKAEELNIQILLEVLSILDSDVFCSIQETADFIRSFHSPALRLQLDTIHIEANQEPHFYEKMVAAGDLISQVDISDGGRMAPDGKHFDFPTLMAHLKEMDYQDYLLCEFRAHPPENAAKAGLDYLRSLM